MGARTSNGALSWTLYQKLFSMKNSSLFVAVSQVFLCEPEIGMHLRFRLALRGERLGVWSVQITIPSRPRVPTRELHRLKWAARARSSVK